MTLRHVCRAGAIGLGLAGLLAMGTPASASEPAFGAGSAGSVNMVQDDEPVTIEPVAPCETGGAPSGDSGGVGVSGVVSYGASGSSCTTDPATGEATVEVTGKRFRLEEIDSAGVPRLKISSYSMRCATGGTGSSSSFTVTGLSGVDVPEEIPPNYTITFAGPTPTAPPSAILVINETIIPDPADGSMSVNLLHLTLNPQGPLEERGEVIVGSVRCEPAS